jgi:hypothetical protein
MISLRAEENLDKEITKFGDKFVQYNFGRFAIENATTEFIKRDLTSLKIDFAVSSSTFQHLPGPLGTYVEFFDLLRIGGIMVTDHMQYKVLDNETSNNFVPTLLLGNFLNQQGHQLVFHHELTGHPRLIAQKHNDNPLEIPFSYHDVISDYSADNYSHTRVAFIVI